MREEPYVSYFRVSTDRQGVSGLGLDAQREAVSQFIRLRSASYAGQVRAGNVSAEALAKADAPGCTIAEFVEIESGAKNDRPQLALALETCRRHNATLLIAKLDRLARNVAFIANLMEGATDFVAVDMPHASRLVLHVSSSASTVHASQPSIIAKPSPTQRR